MLSRGDQEQRLSVRCNGLRTKAGNREVARAARPEHRQPTVNVLSAERPSLGGSCANRTGSACNPVHDGDGRPSRPAAATTVVARVGRRKGNETAPRPGWLGGLVVAAEWFGYEPNT